FYVFEGVGVALLVVDSDFWELQHLCAVAVVCVYGQVCYGFEVVFLSVLFEWCDFFAGGVCGDLQGGVSAEFGVDLVLACLHWSESLHWVDALFFEFVCVLLLGFFGAGWFV